MISPDTRTSRDAASAIAESADQLCEKVSDKVRNWMAQTRLQILANRALPISILEAVEIVITAQIGTQNTTSTTIMIMAKAYRMAIIGKMGFAAPAYRFLHCRKKP